MTNHARVRQLGERTAEYVLIIVLVAITVIGLQKAFGGEVRGQASAGVDVNKGKTSTSDSQKTALVKPKEKGA